MTERFNGLYIYKSPVIKILNDTDFELVEPFLYRWVADKSYQITIPNGFVTDGASVPRFCWSLTGLLPSGVHLGAAVVHDYLYQRRGLLNDGELSVNIRDDQWLPVDQTWTREQCDNMFANIMTKAGETPWKNHAMYWAVRIFGGAAWNN